MKHAEEPNNCDWAWKFHVAEPNVWSWRQQKEILLEGCANSNKSILMAKAGEFQCHWKNITGVCIKTKALQTTLKINSIPVPCNYQCQTGNEEEPSSFNIPANTTIDAKGSVPVKTTGHETLQIHEFWSFCISVTDDSILGNCTMLWSVLTFERSALPSSPLWAYWPLWSNYPVTYCHIAEAQNPHLRIAVMLSVLANGRKLIPFDTLSRNNLKTKKLPREL